MRRGSRRQVDRRCVGQLDRPRSSSSYFASMPRESKRLLHCPKRMGDGVARRTTRFVTRDSLELCKEVRYKRPATGRPWPSRRPRSGAIAKVTRAVVASCRDGAISRRRPKIVRSSPSTRPARARPARGNPAIRSDSCAHSPRADAGRASAGSPPGTDRDLVDRRRDVGRDEAIRAGRCCGRQVSSGSPTPSSGPASSPSIRAHRAQRSMTARAWVEPTSRRPAPRPGASRRREPEGGRRDVREPAGRPHAPDALLRGSTPLHRRPSPRAGRRSLARGASLVWSRVPIDSRPSSARRRAGPRAESRLTCALGRGSQLNGPQWVWPTTVTGHESERRAWRVAPIERSGPMIGHWTSPHERRRPGRRTSAAPRARPPPAAARAGVDAIEDAGRSTSPRPGETTR